MAPQRRGVFNAREGARVQPTTLATVALLLVVGATLLVLLVNPRASEGGANPVRPASNLEGDQQIASIDALTELITATFVEDRRTAMEELREYILAAETLWDEVPEEVQNSKAGRDLAEVLSDAKSAARAENTRQSDLRRIRASLAVAAVEVGGQEEAYEQLLGELDKLFEDSNAAVVALDLESGKPFVSYNPTEQFVAASTYKILVAYSMIRAVESGSLSWDSPFLYTTVGDCMDRMLTYSDNECPRAWLHEYSHKFVEDQARELGAKNTSLTGTDLTTDASDLATVLRALAVDDVISEDSRETMLDLMLNQETRDGLPAGVDPDRVRVADKVGYLESLLHDAAIVYSDKGDYTLVVLTENSTWESIAEVGALVYEYY